MTTVSIIKKFADDTQLYNVSQPGHFHSLITDSESCIESIKVWMIPNKLKLNDDTIEAWVLGSRSCISLIDRRSIATGGNCVPFSRCVKDSGVHPDNTLSMHQHISYLCRSSFLPLEESPQSDHTWLKALLPRSRSNYCNSIFAGLQATEINHLQRIKNNAAMLVLRKSKIVSMFQHCSNIYVGYLFLHELITNCNTGLSISSLWWLITTLPFFDCCHLPALSLTEI